MAGDDERAREWAAADKTVADGVPLAVSEADTPRPETTDAHRLTPALFANAVELADRDGYARGFKHGDDAGYKRGLADGEAKVRAYDWAAGVEDALAGVRVYLLSEGIMHGEAFTAKAMPFIKRTG